MKKLLLGSVIVCAACHTTQKFPEAKDVKMGANVHPDCKEIGVIRGRSLAKTPNIDEAMNDLKKEASDQGANYVQISHKSSHGTEVVGKAFNCP